MKRLGWFLCLTITASICGILHVASAKAPGCFEQRLCCLGQNDDCFITDSVTNETLCFCDEACLNLTDCCDDYLDTCRRLQRDCNESLCMNELTSIMENYSNLLKNSQLNANDYSVLCSVAHGAATCMDDIILMGCNVTDIPKYQPLVHDIAPYLCNTQNQNDYTANQACYTSQAATTSAILTQFFSTTDCASGKQVLLNYYNTLSSSCGQSAAVAATELALRINAVLALSAGRDACVNVFMPMQQSAPDFVGPVSIARSGPLCPSYTDFYFECRINYDRTDAESRFDVSLTFDGEPDPNVPESHVTTNSSALVVVFYSSALRGNMGKKVSCEVTSYYLGSFFRSAAWHSTDDYWVGIAYVSDFSSLLSNQIKASYSDWVDIEFRSTVPLALSDCSNLLLDIQVPSVRTSSCSIYFDDSMLRFTLTVQTDPKPSCASFETAISFHSPQSRSVATIWDNYVLGGIGISFECYLSQKLCQSYHEPLIVTFDGWQYITRTFPGDFLLYRRQVGSRLFEVHTRHVECSYSSTTTCNCAVAVREGNDVLGVHSCTGSVVPIRYMTDPNTPNGKADITYKKIAARSSYYGSEYNYCFDDNGEVYEIVMPSGSLVRVRVWEVNKKPYLNIYIYIHPGYHGGTGLCGNYNNDISDDQTGLLSTSSLENYRLSDSQSYINGHIHPIPCTDSQKPATVCNCINGQPSNCATDENRKHAKSFNTPNTDACSNGARKKRSVPEVADDIITQDDIPLPPPQQPGPDPLPPTWPTPSGITREKAEESCRDVLETFPPYSLCLSYVYEGFLNSSCIEQILLLDSIEHGTSMMLDDLKQRCVFSIASSLQANSNDPERQPEFVEEMLQTIEANDCPGQPTACSGHGNCSAGICTCDQGHAGFGCEANSTDVPVLSHLRKGCLCDVRTVSCQNALILASQFYSSPNLTCKIEPSDQSASARPYFSSPEFVSKTQLSCPLPNYTTVATYDISVSNDGISYSNVLQMRVYDSLCLDCNCTEQCTQKTTTCYIDGQCFASNERNPSDSGLVCDPRNNVSGWTAGTDDCTSSPCANGGTCVDQLNGYSCTCVYGFTGTLCQTDINECQSSPCLNGGTCFDVVNAYTCSCGTGFTGYNCQTGVFHTTAITTTAAAPTTGAPQPPAAQPANNKKKKKNNKKAKKTVKKTQKKSKKKKKN